MSRIPVDKITEELRKISTRIDYTDLHTSLDRCASLTKASDTTKLGQLLGENLGGFECLAEVAKTEGEKLLVLYEPVIALMKASVPGLEQDIKKDITSDNTTAINSIISNSAVDIHAVVPTATAVDIHATTVSSSMNHAVIADASPIALKDGAGTATGIVDTSVFTTMMQAVTEDDLKAAVTEAVEVLQSDELQADLTKTFSDLDTKIIKATNGLNSGSLLKDITENFSSGFGNILGNFGSEFTTGNNINSILNTLLGGSNIGAIDKSASVKIIPPSLSREASENGISTDVKNLNGAQTFINSISKSISGANFTTLIDEYKAGIDDIITKLGGSKTTVAATINDGNTARHRVRNAETTKADNTFTSLSSQEEITSILSSTNRQFTTVVWHWSGHYNNAANIGAAELDTEYKAIGLKESPYHFVIKKNGIIETGISTENESAHTLEAFRKLSIGVVFIGGYNGEPGGPPGTVNLDVKSLTRAQWDSFYMFMKAFYFERPGGCAYGQNDLIERPNSTDGPGFDVGEKIATYPFNKRNVGNPVLNNKFLTNAEIISELKVSERIINESRDIQ
jgi:hypothetical protein